ncbi:MAG: hypothetical protein MZU97_18850 [Bacillus subtilis]|nr:hypothetical protein [Bacillus subtilis]
MVEIGGSGPLARRHRAGAFPITMAHVQDEPGVRGDRESDLVGEELGHVEGHKAVYADGFLRIGESAQASMESEPLAGQPVQAVLDRSAGKLEIAAQCPEALGRSVTIEEVRVIHEPLGVVIEGK